MRQLEKFMKVLKFGGSSVGNPKTIQLVMNIVEKSFKNDKQTIVVCSAFGGVTDQLINAGKLAASKDNSYKDIIDQIKTRHLSAIDELVCIEMREAPKKELEEALITIENLLNGIFLLNEFPDRTQAQLISFGERMSCFIVAAAMRSKGLPGIYVNASEIIKTDKNYLSGKVDFKKTDKNIVSFFETINGIGVVTGFIASDEDGNITTLGRGGSDYTVSILGAALKADMIEIWTDVDGVLTADPRRVDQAFSIPSLTYREAMELSHFGAKVIYPPTIQPAYNSRIPLTIKNTFNPDNPGTLISEKIEKSDSPIKGISSITNVCLMRLEGSGLMGGVGMAARLFNSLAQAGVNIIFLTQGSSEHSICFGVVPGDAKKSSQAIYEEFKWEMESKYINPLIIEYDKTIIAVVGENMAKVPGVSAKVFKALGKNGINVTAIAQGSSELNITAIIDTFNEAKALNALHEIFFKADHQSINLFLVGPTGLIGNTLINQIQKQFDYLNQKKSIKINLTGLINSKKMLIDSNGIDLSNWENELNEKGETSDLTAFTDQMILLNFANSVMVDCSASKDVTEFYEKVLSKSISIVTPNKIANTLSQEKYEKLRAISKNANAKFLYETNVGAGLPVINTLHSLLESGDQILKIEAVLSGTLSFIFNTFKGDLKFSDVVLLAKEKGFTEPDPRDDLSGLDVARKALILSRETGVSMNLEEIAVENLVFENLRNVDTATFMARLPEMDEEYEKMKKSAEQEGMVLRYMAVIENGIVKIALNKVDHNHPFYPLSGSDNMIVFTTERYKTNPLVIKGPGAGAAVTAAGVFAEIISIGNYLAN